MERNRHRRLDDGVEIALHSSHDALRPPARRLFRLLALHPGDDLDAYAAAAMAGADLDTALAVLDELVTSSLLRQRTHGRYELHDMVRLYAAARAVDEEPESARRDALTRLFDHYLHTAATAMAALYPVRRGLLPIPEPPTSVPPVTEPAGARAWLAAERPNLLAAVAHSAAHGWPSHTHRLAATVARHLDIGGHHGDALAIHTHALGAARVMGDRHAEATTLGYLGILHWRVTRHDLSIEHTSRAIALFHELGDRTSEALALANIGVVAELAGRYEESAGHALRSLAVCREAGHRDGEGIALNNVGLALLRLGRYAESVEYSQRSLDIRHEQGDRAGEALVLCNLGAAYQHTGRHPEAIDHYRRALAIGRETGYRHVECHALSWLGVLDQREGHLERAVERNRQALAIAAVLDDASLESEVHNNLGHALRAAGRPVEAQEHHRSAIALASAAGFRLDHARALDGLAHAMSAAGRTTQARQHWQAALTIHHELGTPEAGEIRSRLAELDREPA